MVNSASGKQFKSLLDEVEADEWRAEELDDDILERAAMGRPLGPPPPPQSIVLSICVPSPIP
jgi:hypothetical protein